MLREIIPDNDGYNHYEKPSDVVLLFDINEVISINNSLKLLTFTVFHHNIIYLFPTV